jgi:hypothetical protein
MDFWLTLGTGTGFGFFLFNFLRDNLLKIKFS